MTCCVSGNDLVTRSNQSVDDDRNTLFSTNGPVICDKVDHVVGRVVVDPTIALTEAFEPGGPWRVCTHAVTSLNASLRCNSGLPR